MRRNSPTRGPTGTECNFSRDFPEKRLDNLPPQQLLIRSGEELELGPGVIYHGMRDLTDLLTPKTDIPFLDFTRVGYQYGYDCFLSPSPDRHPGMIVLKTETFNALAKQGNAVLKTPKRRDGEIEPWARVRANSIEPKEVEVWVTQSTYDYYLSLSANLAHSEHAQTDTKRLDALVKSLRVVPNLESAKNETDLLSRTLFRYVAGRNLLKEIPIFQKK